MTIERKPIGQPFAGDYPDTRDDDQRECDRRAVGRQLRSLGTPEAEDPYHAALLRRLRERRRGFAVDNEAIQFDVVPDGHRSLLVASGELVLRREELDDERVGRLLEAWGFDERRDLPGDCEALSQRVARFVSPGLPVEDLLAVRRALRGKGVRADVDHITPLAGVVKGEGGPENTTGRRDVGALAWESHGSVAVAVLDTGIAEEKRGDGWLGHDVIERRGDNIDVLDALPPGGDGLLDFATGHGTFVTGVVQQVCPDADVRVYRAADSDGIGTEIELGCALVRAVRDGAQVVNISLGTRTQDDGPPVALEAAFEVVAEIEAEQQREVLVVAAAGNYGDTRPCWPAAFRRVVAVAGLTAEDQPATAWSSHGVWVDCSTVGEGVVSTYLKGIESPVFDPEPDEFGEDAWAVWTGTSFAAPQIAGAVARESSQTGTSPRQALTSLLARGVVLPGFGRALHILPGS